MNICIILGRSIGYSETFIKAHVEHLKAKVFSAVDLPFRGYYIQSSKKEPAGTVKQLAKKVYNLGSEKYKYLQFRKFIQKHRIQLVLAEYGMNGVMALEACKRLGIPLVVHFHGFDAYRKDVLEHYQYGYAQLFAYAKAIIAVSRDMQSQIIGLGAPANKVFYNVYGVDVKKFETSDVLATPRQLIAVGRFVKKKAPYLTILAFQKVLQTFPDARLVMVGDGELLDVCVQIVQSLGLEQSIFIRGSLPHEEVAKLMRSSRAFVQHSLMPPSGDSEGTPNTILEAQASALPVISTRHAGIKDVVVQGKTGFLVEEGDVNAMADCMVKLLQDAQFAAGIGVNARRHILENYTIEKSIYSLKEILNEAAG